MLAVAAAGLFALASMMLLPATASSQTADQITLTVVQVATGARDVEAAPGDTVTMTIRASGAEAMQGLQFTLAYNPAVVEVVDVSLAETQPGALFAANTTTPSEIVVVFVVQAPVGVAEVDIANLIFRVVGEPGASTSLSFAAIAAGDGSDPSQAIPATSVSGSITVISQAQQAEATPTVVPASTPVPAPTEVPDTPTPTPAPAPLSPAVTPEAQQTPAATPQPVQSTSPEPTPTPIAGQVATGPTAVPTTQAPAASSTPARPEPSPVPAVGTEAQKPQEAASPGPLAAQVAGVPQRPEVAGTPEPGAVPPTPSAAQVQVQASQAGSEPTAGPPQAQPQGGMGCTAPLLGSSASASGLGDLMLLGTVVGSLLISSRLRRR
ncbi:MAG: hypothetical protein IH862_11360 [Chloroflexi bacterium]|nr:hypothetical protein [Chloroflexota bacterium]